MRSYASLGFTRSGVQINKGLRKIIALFLSKSKTPSTPRFCQLPFLRSGTLPASKSSILTTNRTRLQVEDSGLVNRLSKQPRKPFFGVAIATVSCSVATRRERGTATYEKRIETDRTRSGRTTVAGLSRWLQDGGTFPDQNGYKKLRNSKEALILSRFDTF